MTKIRFVAAGVLLVAAVLVALPALAQGTPPDLRDYVAVGDSVTAGFSHGGLVAEAQELSYPSLIFQQATGLPAAAFQQPLVSAPGLPPLLRLANIAPVTITTRTGFGAPLNLNLPFAYNNMAVPGTDTGEALRLRSDNGGLHDLILRGIGTQIEQAAGQGPSFITVFLGNNDALSAATTGVPIDGVTLTTAASFDADYRTIMGILAATGAPIVVATISDVTALPFVTAIAPVVVNPVTNEPVLIGGQLVPLIGPDGPLVPGQDFVLLTATQELAVGNGVPTALGGSGMPLTNQVVLSANEVALIQSRTNDFNATIRSAAADVGASLVDTAGIFASIARNGLVLGGIEFGVDFLTGGLFGYDGVHPTPLGYAIVANAFIDVINADFGASIPRVSLGPYIFGPLSAAGTQLTGATTAGARFTRKAEDQLRAVLGVPLRRDLRAIMRNRGIAETNGGGTGGGGSGGGGSGGAGSTCQLPAGHPKYCDICGPCKAGQGDCDLKPNQCRAGLVCAQNVGADYGFHPKIDICQAP